MSRIKSRNTTPEKKIRSLLHSLGYRFRLHRKDLPGKPDIVLPKFKTVIFIHGCFWHKHKGCKRANTPKSNLNYWIPKLARNVKNDKKHIRDLRKKGWKTMVIWECTSKNPSILKSVLRKLENGK